MNRRAVDGDGRPSVDEKFSRRRAGTMGLLSVGVAALMVLLLAAPGAPASAVEAPDDIASTTLTLPASPDEPADETTPASTPAAEPLVTRPPITANDFIPEDQDLTSCIGVLERPGCGSESRGGWRQTLVLGALFAGLVVIFGNVARGVRKRDQGSATSPPAADGNGH